ncbi:MAG: phage holin family protein [Prevotella sp.]|nr:phage holin family protein [Prevotella sp.]
MEETRENIGLKAFLEEIKQELTIYLNRRIRLLKLESYEVGSKAASSIGYGLILVGIVFLILFFVLLGLAFFIGELLGSLAAGFGVMAIVSALLLLLVVLFRKPLKRSMLNKTIIFFRNIESNED